MTFTLNIVTLIIACALNASPLIARAQTTTKDFVTIKREKIVWKDGDLGVKSTVLFGDPTKAGLYIVRNIFPAGIMSTPHSHDQDRYVTRFPRMDHADMAVRLFQKRRQRQDQSQDYIEER